MSTALVELDKDFSDIIERLQCHRGVVGIIVTTIEGQTIHSTFNDTELTNRHVETAKSIIQHTGNELNPTHKEATQWGQLNLIRIRTTKQEIMIAKEKNYLLVAIQTLKANENDGDNSECNDPKWKSKPSSSLSNSSEYCCDRDKE